LLLVSAMAAIVLGQTAPEPKLSCERQPFKKLCSATQSIPQFTLRYYLKDGMCCSYPWGYCPGDEISKETSIRTKAACEAVCVRGEPSGVAKGGGPIGGQGAGGAGQPGATPGAGTPGAGTPGAGTPGSQGGGGTPGTAAPVQKSCARLPYKSQCQITQSVAQFTLRWYVRDNMCCSYPWGYCPGDEIVKEAAIRTKEECEQTCLGKPGTPSVGGAQAGGAQAGGHTPAGPAPAGQTPAAQTPGTNAGVGGGVQAGQNANTNAYAGPATNAPVSNIPSQQPTTQSPAPVATAGPVAPVSTTSAWVTTTSQYRERREQNAV